MTSVPYTCFTGKERDRVKPGSIISLDYKPERNKNFANLCIAILDRGNRDGTDFDDEWSEFLHSFVDLYTEGNRIKHEPQMTLYHIK